MAKKTSSSQKKEVVPVKETFLLIISCVFFNISAQSFGVPSRTTVGVGARAFAMGNNYVALSSDASAMFWNPAGLAFTPVREFLVTLNGFSHNLDTEYEYNALTAKVSSDRQRIRPDIIAYLRSFPTTRGGFSIAFGFQSPYMLDDILKFNVRDSFGVSESFDYYSFGQLNLWTAAFGIQVAPDFGVGAAVSLLTGRNTMKLNNTYYFAPGAIDRDYDYKLTQSYLGCDIRFGLQYSLFDRMKIGMRIVFPQFILFDEEYRSEEILPDSIDIYKDTNTGRLKTSPSGAFGISYRFSFMTISGEIRTRTPIPDAEEESNYAYWKVGAGIGIEVPLFVESLFLRAGYSWQEYDRNPMLIVYDNPPDEFVTDLDAEIVKDEHLFATGFSYLTKYGLSFDISYGYKFWELLSYHGELTEQHDSHRVVASFAIRF